MKLITDGRKALLATIALLGCFGFALNAQAQTCVVSNWTSATGLVDGDAGVPDLDATDNRRYGGPCGLRVDVDGTARFLVDESPANETTYIARFYVFLDTAGGAPVRIFEASDGTANQIEIWYNDTGAGELNMVVGQSGGGTTSLDWGTVGSGWHSVELVWEQAASANIILNVDGGTDVTASVDTSGITIADAAIGNLNGASTAGAIDFDDFDSRRIERPGRLLVGDGSGDGVIDINDALALRNELLETAVAPGQPDCDESGLIDISDALCLRNLLN